MSYLDYNKVNLLNKIKNKLGKTSENYMEKVFKQNKYFAYKTTSEVGKQPVDFIGFKKDKILFADIKHLDHTKKSFDFSRIELNQLTSMEYASKCLDYNMNDINNLITNRESVIKDTLNNKLIMGFIIVYDLLEDNSNYLLKDNLYKDDVSNLIKNSGVVDKELLQQYFLKNDVKSIAILFISYKIIYNKLLKGEKSIRLDDDKVVSILDVL